MALGWKLNLRCKIKAHCCQLFAAEFYWTIYSFVRRFFLAFSMICVERGNAPHKTAYQKLSDTKYKVTNLNTFLVFYLESCMEKLLCFTI